MWCRLPAAAQLKMAACKSGDLAGQHYAMRAPHGTPPKQRLAADIRTLIMLKTHSSSRLSQIQHEWANALTNGDGNVADSHGLQV